MVGIVITGASGFLGRNLIDGLNSRSLAFAAISRRNEPGFQRVSDYRDTPFGDIIIHLAEDSDRSSVNASGQQYLEESCAVVRALCKRAGTVVYASSSVVYGDESETPFCTNAPLKVNDLYSQCKTRNEEIVLNSGGTVLRLSNLFGPGMSPHNVISDIAKQLQHSGPLKVRDTSPVCDFLSIGAVVDAILLFLNSPSPGVFNIGSGVGLSIRQVALLALEQNGQRDREIVATQPAGRRSVNILDITKTRRKLEWSPGPCTTTALTDYFHTGVNIDFE